MLNANTTERKFARFHSLYTRDFKKDAAIYLDLAAKCAGPVLEIGCATGRVTGHLAAAGFEVHGIDTRRPMLEIARRHLEPWAARASVADFDLRRQPLPERYGLILSTLYAFNDLIDVEEQRLFLRHLLRSLAPGGVLAMDLFCPLSYARPEAGEGWREIEHTVDGQRLRVRDLREMLTPLLERRTQRFRVDDESEEELVSHRRYIPPQQAAALLAESGFEKLRVIPGYDLAAAGPVDAPVPAAGPFILVGQI